MTAVFFVLSSPVIMPDASFGVLIGTAHSVHIRQYQTLWRAKIYQVIQLALLRAAVDAPLDIVLIDGANSSLDLKGEAEAEYGRRGLLLPPWGASRSGFERSTTDVRRMAG